jgi:hypothetical protein
MSQDNTKFKHDFLFLAIVKDMLKTILAHLAFVVCFHGLVESCLLSAHGDRH